MRRCRRPAAGAAGNAHIEALVVCPPVEYSECPLQLLHKYQQQTADSADQQHMYGIRSRRPRRRWQQSAAERRHAPAAHLGCSGQAAAARWACGLCRFALQA